MINNPKEQASRKVAKNIAVILAGGAGVRFGSDIPKQHIKIGHKSVLDYTIDAFERHEHIDEIVLVVAAGYEDGVKKRCAQLGRQKVRHIVTGGKERYLSSLAALQIFETGMDAPSCNLLFHDAARPLVSETVITNVIMALQEHQAVTVAVPATDTILQKTQDGRHIACIPDRSLLMAAQTPQGFQLPIIREAYRRAIASGSIVASDDCGIVLSYMPEVPIFIASGDPRNIKITYPDDFDRFAEIVGKNLL